MEFLHFRQELPIKTNLLEQVRRVISVQHCSIRTEEAYLNWIYTRVLNKGGQGVQSPVDSIMEVKF